MSEGAIEPTAVYPRGAGIQTGRQKFYETYNTRLLADEPMGGGDTGGGGGFNYQGGFIHRTMSRVPNGSGPQVSVPTGVPKFLGSRAGLLLAWVVAMAMVSLDEWHTNHILPRPARLWYTSLLFFLLAIVSTIDAMVPIVNLFALGMVIVLGMQYYSGTGQFGTTGETESGGSPTTAADSATAGALTGAGTGASPITQGVGQ